MYRNDTSSALRRLVTAYLRCSWCHPDCGLTALAQTYAEHGLELDHRLFRVGVMYPDHAHLHGALDVWPEVVDEHTLLGLEVEQTAGVGEDLRLGLAHADLPRDHHDVEQLVPALAGVVHPPRVRQEGGLHASPAGVPQHVEHHRLVLEAREHPGEQTLGLHRRTTPGLEP